MAGSPEAASLVVVEWHNQTGLPVMGPFLQGTLLHGSLLVADLPNAPVPVDTLVSDHACLPFSDDVPVPCVHDDVLVVSTYF